MLIRTEQPSLTALTELACLTQDCKQHDGHAIGYYPNLLSAVRPKPATLLQYEDNALIAYASVFFFEHNSGEIALSVHPLHRKKGLASKLLKTLLLDILQERPVHNAVFSTPHARYTQAWINRGFSYQRTEYDMTHNLRTLPPNAPTEACITRATNSVDVFALCDLDTACFPNSVTFSATRFRQLLAETNYCIFIATLGNQLIGKAHLAYNTLSAKLSDIAITPSLQRQGHGQALVIHCLQYAFQQGLSTVTLSVETNNQHALRLYQGLGFSVDNAIDYWSKPIEELMR